MKKLFVFLVCLLFALNATAICPKPEVSVVFKKNLGRVTYNNRVSHNFFYKIAPSEVPDTVRGLTIAKLDVDYQAEGTVFRQKKQHCAGVKRITFTIGYEKLRVYIDSAYKPGSCEYSAIKAHEAEHVEIFRQGLRFFEPDIKKALTKAAKKVISEPVNTTMEAQKAFDRQARSIINEIQPLLNHINRKINEKQLSIDTKASYREVMRKCRNW